MTNIKATNIKWHKGAIIQSDRERLLGQKGVVLWFTGLSGSGKSTLAHAVEEKLYERGHLTYVLDGDNIRHKLNKNLGFSPGDRKENIRRIGEVARLFTDAGIITMAAFISPYKEDRARARKLITENRFIEVYTKIPLEVVEKRDPKGLYKKARAGEIKQFTGIDAPYEEPENAELIVETSENNLNECTRIIIEYLEKRGVVE